MAKKFFPIKNWLGGDHKKNGITIESETVTFEKAEGYHNESTSFNINDVEQVIHVAKFKFFFLVIVYTYEFIHSIAFIDKAGQVLATLPVGNMKAKHLLELLKTMKQVNSAMRFDVPTGQAIAKDTVSPLNNAYYKAIMRGLKWWGIAFVVIIGGLIGLGIMGSN